MNPIRMSKTCLHDYPKGCFLKTKIDIVYSDYMNWERGNLLMNQYEKGEKSPKKADLFRIYMGEGGG